MEVGNLSRTRILDKCVRCYDPVFFRNPNAVYCRRCSAVMKYDYNRDKLKLVRLRKDIRNMKEEFIENLKAIEKLVKGGK